MGGAHLRIHGPRSPSLCHAGCKGFSAKSTSVPFPHISATFEQDVSGASTSGLGDCSGKLGKGLPVCLRVRKVGAFGRLWAETVTLCSWAPSGGDCREG